MLLRWIFILLIFPAIGFAQTDAELDKILGLTEDEKAVDNVYKEADKEEVGKLEEEDKKSTADTSKDKIIKKDSISGLSVLAPFKDIAVIQRRFLPKTSRFEFFPGIGLVANNSFYWPLVLSGKIGYHFSEYIAVEAGFALISSNSRKVTDDLETKLSVEIDEIVIPEAYYGLDFKWSPVYGKMGLSKTTIVPFDMYFLLGGGITQTNQDTTPFTMHVGTGQLFALSKMAAFRWDLGWYFYNTDTRGGTISGNFTDMYLTVGVSLFFPEAKYR